MNKRPNGTTTKEIFAKRIYLLRKAKGLSLAEVAEQVNITHQSLGLYENRQRTANIETLVKIAKYFNVSTDYLLGFSEEKLIKIEKKVLAKSTASILTELDKAEKKLSEIKSLIEELGET